MKLKKTLSSILIGIGCIIVLIGLAAFILPQYENRQLQLVLSSFRTPSDNWLIQLMNNGMCFAMDHCFLMLLIGSAIMLGGVLLGISAQTDEAIQAQRNARKGTATAGGAAGMVSSRYARPTKAPEPHAATARPSEDNPFARYMKGDVLPKSTAVAADAQPAKPAELPAHGQNESGDSHDDILTLWETIQQQPEEADNLYIQPVRVEDDQAYRRPVEEAGPAVVQSTVTYEMKETESAPPVQPETEAVLNLESVSESAPETSPEPVIPPAPAAQPEPQPTGQRPIIRSTFRKSTNEQPPVEPVIPEEASPAASVSGDATSVEKSPEETSPEAAAPGNVSTAVSPLQPASRIKSTMGRKR